MMLQANSQVHEIAGSGPGTPIAFDWRMDTHDLEMQLVMLERTVRTLRLRAAVAIACTIALAAVAMYRVQDSPSSIHIGGVVIDDTGIRIQTSDRWLRLTANEISISNPDAGTLISGGSLHLAGDLAKESSIVELEPGRFAMRYLERGIRQHGAEASLELLVSSQSATQVMHSDTAVISLDNGRRISTITTNDDVPAFVAGPSPQHR